MHDRGDTLLGDREKMVRGLRRMNSIDCDFCIAVGTVFEAHRHRETRCEFTVHLALGRACADGTPAHAICYELWADRVQKFAAEWQPQRRQIDEQFSRNSQPFVDFERAIDVRVIDQAFPA